MMSGRLRMAGHGYRRHQAHFPHERFLQQPLPIAPCVSQEGQFSANQLANDVWCSTDGATWTAATTAAPWGGREFAELVSFNGRLWILGGFWGGVYADIWSSADGVSWVQETHKLNLATLFSSRHYGRETAVAHRGKRWVSECPARCLVQLRTDANGLWSRAVPNSHLASRKCRVFERPTVGYRRRKR